MPGFGPCQFGGPPGHMGAVQSGKAQVEFSTNFCIFCPGYLLCVFVLISSCLFWQVGPPQVSGVKVPYPGGPYGPGPAPALLFQNPPPPLQECNDSFAGKMGFGDWSAPYDSTQVGNRLPNHHTAAPSGTSPSPTSSSDGEEQNDTSTK